MQKTSPLARAVRTFVFAIAGSAVAWAGIDWVSNFRAGATLVTLNVIAAALAAVIAGLLALSNQYQAQVNSPALRAVATFAQVTAAGLGVVAMNSLTGAAALAAGKGIEAAVVGGAVAAVVAFLQNAAENQPA